MAVALGCDPGIGFEQHPVIVVHEKGDEPVVDGVGEL